MIKLEKDMQLTKNFTLDEFANHLGNGTYALMPDMRLVTALQRLRGIVGSITVTSGYRTVEFNKQVGGSSNSYHLDGLAADVKFDFSDWCVESLTKVLQNFGFINVNFYMDKGIINRLHVDVGQCRRSNQEFYYRNLFI